jgi:hypothetical protein
MKKWAFSNCPVTVAVAEEKAKQGGTREKLPSLVEIPGQGSFLVIVE